MVNIENLTKVKAAIFYLKTRDGGEPDVRKAAQLVLEDEEEVREAVEAYPALEDAITLNLTTLYWLMRKYGCPICGSKKPMYISEKVEETDDNITVEIVAGVKCQDCGFYYSIMDFAKKVYWLSLIHI